MMHVMHSRRMFGEMESSSNDREVSTRKKLLDLIPVSYKITHMKKCEIKPQLLT